MNGIDKIQNVEVVVNLLGRWRPSDLAFIESLTFNGGVSGQDSTLELVAIFQRRDFEKPGWPSSDSPRIKVSIEFGFVRDLRLKNFGPSPKQILGFDIHDVSSRQLQDIKFVIEDYENDEIAFHCKTIRIVTAERV